MDDFAARLAKAKTVEDAVTNARAQAEAEELRKNAEHRASFLGTAPKVAAALERMGVARDVRITVRGRTTTRRFMKDVVTETVDVVAEGWGFGMRTSESQDTDGPSIRYRYHASGQLLMPGGRVADFYRDGWSRLPVHDGVLTVELDEPWGARDVLNGPIKTEAPRGWEPRLDKLVEMVLRYRIDPALLA